MDVARTMLVLVLSGVALTACGGGSESDNCASSSCSQAGSGGSQPTGATSLLGAGATSYAEAQEVKNGSSGGAELTGYVLETEHGIAVTGSFESASPTPDSFVFNSGAMGTAREPGFPGADIQVVIDGRVLDTGAGESLGLDTVQEFGYSSLLGVYFKNAALITGKDYVLRINPSAALAGKSYTLEIRGHVVQK
jgi:hypothetical protein